MANGDYVETIRQIQVNTGDVLYHTKGVAATRTSPGVPYLGKALAAQGANQAAPEFTITDIVPVCAAVSLDEQENPGRITINAMWKQPIARSKTFTGLA